MVPTSTTFDRPNELFYQINVCKESGGIRIDLSYKCIESIYRCSMIYDIFICYNCGLYIYMNI